MKVLVAVKRVIDFAASIRVKPDESGVDMAQVKMSMNPFDEIAVEEAVRLKEKNIATEVIVVTIGHLEAQETLRNALARGADRAILVEATDEIQPLAAAKILRAIVEQESPSLIILGKQAIDTDNNQTGQMLAALLQWPQATFTSKLEIKSPSTLQATREIDGGLETLELKLPALITTDLRLNEPRFLSLPNIVQAKRKPLTIIPIAELQVDFHPRLRTIRVHSPEKKRAGIRVNSARELIEKLKHFFLSPDER